MLILVLDIGLPQHPVVGLALVPPELVTVGHGRTHICASSRPSTTQAPTRGRSLLISRIGHRIFPCSRSRSSSPAASVTRTPTVLPRPAAGRSGPGTGPGPPTATLKDRGRGPPRGSRSTHPAPTLGHGIFISTRLHFNEGPPGGPHEYLLCNGLSVGYLGEIKGFLGDEGHLAGPGWKPGDLLSLLGETQEEPQEESESESGQSEKRSQRSGGQNIYFVTPPCFIRVPPGFRRALERPHGAMPSPLCPLPDGASGTSQAAGPHRPPPG